MKYINKSLSIEKIKIQDIAKKFGTPTYCYSYRQLKENINNFKKNFKSFSPLICFAIKSNTNVNLIRQIKILQSKKLKLWMLLKNLALPCTVTHTEN